jgi:Uma2 family endonuclease
MTTIPDTAAMVVRASHVPGPPQGRWPYADYARLDDLDEYHNEIIDGVLYMIPAPPLAHNHIAALVGARLVAAVEDAGLGQVFGSPDIDIGPPDLVVEIASPSTAAYDRDPDEGKRGAYARIGVPEYWIVDPLNRSIDVLTLEGDHYRSVGVFQGDDSLTSPLLPGISAPAQRFFPRQA